MLTHLKRLKHRLSSPPPPPSSVTKYKITVTQPANGKIEVSPALPADGKVDKGSEFTFTFSANTNYKVKELIINGITYSNVTDNTITQKVKIEKDTAVSAAVEAEASLGTKYKITVTQPANGKIDVSPALPADGKVDKGSEFTFTLSANTGYKVKELIINGITYSNVTDNTITQKIKIEKNTAVSAAVEEEANPTPDTGIFTDTQGNKVTIIPIKDGNEQIQSYELKGAVYIEDFNSEEFKNTLKKLDGKELNTAQLNINCFKQNSAAGTFTATDINPDLLENILTIGTEYNFSNFKLNNQTPNDNLIEILFGSDATNYFDISDLAKFSFNKEFKLQENSTVVLGGLPLQEDKIQYDKAQYITIDELVSVIKQKHFKNFQIKNIGLRRNIKTILPYLTDGTFQDKEIEGKGVEFAHSWRYSCDSEYFTGYLGSGEGDILTLTQVKEISKRYPYNGARLQNVTLTGIDTKNIQEGELDGIMKTSSLDNITFKDSDFSKVIMKSVNSHGYLKFEDTTLPQGMGNTTSDNIVLKNVTFSKEEFENIGTFEDLPYITPEIRENLTIYGEIKSSPLKSLTQEQIEKLKKDQQKPNKMPTNYTGPIEIYNRLIYIYKGEAKTINGNTNPNYQGSIQKQQSQLLALLQAQNKSRG